MAGRGWIRVHELADGESVEIGGVEIRPFRLAEDYVYAFELRDGGGGRRLLVAPDELNGWVPPGEVRRPDLALLPMGICEFDPLSGERRIHEDHPVLRFEATFEETLAIVEGLDASRVILTHIEEMDGLTHDDLLQLQERLPGNVTFTYDGLQADV
jgi:phosphoribosyl 1,2-cyclic phosphate phosphodiesterase